MWTFQRAPGETAAGARTNGARGERRGFCPSVWTPMESGDGLIVRFSARAAALTACELRVLATAARDHGNGLLEITRRGKLQLRGVRPEALRPLRAELEALGLADSSAVTVNPFAGLAPGSASLTALASELDRALAASGVRVRLSDKFGVVLDSGDVLHDVEADIRIDVAAEGDRVQLSVASEPLGDCPTDQCAAAVVALAQTLADSPHVRMRDLVRADGTSALLTSLDALAVSSLPSEAWSLEPGAAPPRIGFSSPSTDLSTHLTVGVPFGSGEHAQWQALAAIAERFGSGELRITPFRSVVLPGVRAVHAPAIEHAATEAGFIVDPSDPLLRAVACPGAPACASAHGPTRPLARQLARELLPLLAADARLHVSGCSKRCAHRGPATVTLVHDPAGSQLDLDLASGA